jgi:hypothetical protein
MLRDCCRFKRKKKKPRLISRLISAGRRGGWRAAGEEAAGRFAQRDGLARGDAKRHLGGDRVRVKRRGNARADEPARPRDAHLARYLARMTELHLGQNDDED